MLRSYQPIYKVRSLTKQKTLQEYEIQPVQQDSSWKEHEKNVLSEKNGPVLSRSFVKERQ
jgi:hypothetical protein